MKHRAFLKLFCLISFLPWMAQGYTTYCYIAHNEAIGMFCAQGSEGVVAVDGTITQYDRDGYVVDTYSTKVSKSVANSCQEAMTATADDKAIGCSFTLSQR